LASGERGVLLNGTSIFRIDNVDVYQYTAWKEGKLIFRNEYMSEVVKNLTRWYNVNIIIRDSQLEFYAYRATFMDEKLDEVLNIFQHTSPIRYKELGRNKDADGTFGKRTIELYCDTQN
jgi:transmembrane sensor